MIAVDTTDTRGRLTAPPFTRTRRVAITFTASDLHGVTGYVTSQSPALPPADAPGWRATPPTSYVLAGSPGLKNIYAFTRDGAKNVSVASARVLLDTTAPTLVVTTPRRGISVPIVKSIAGRMSDRGTSSGIKRAGFALLKVNGCEWWDLKKHTLVPGACGTRLWFPIGGVAEWPRDIGKVTAPGHYRLYVFVEDRAGNRTQKSVDFTITG